MDGKRWALVALVVAETLFIGYLIAEAFRADAAWRPWYLIGAGGLSLLTGAIVWSRIGRRRS
ncbi:hypothetical protein [Catenuloplanes atrovinosus]|uniref:Uncharacterized protein n=1 Tax=Catenuloplanes atrovinosus TaxID=137266 RepID=A0AAE4C909_9ACTN|nr:hypothetical protein [Catenuloplanes atrovinosus]MDR7275217.1 hypothetical protein [Catenuloplanes atrovinosus]